jgi:hypothetical protein
MPQQPMFRFGEDENEAFVSSEAFGPCGVALSAPATHRLSRQCAAIYARLQRGPATNSELSQLALSYTRRLSDLRAHGIGVECFQRDDTTGLNWYRLA